MRAPMRCSRRSSGAWGSSIRVLLLLVATVGLLAPRALAAQEPRNWCEGRRITRIIVSTLPPYPDAFLRRWEPLIDAIHFLHATTRPQVVRRYLVFQTGEMCSSLRLAESERILRAQPFLADATVTAHPDQDGVRVEIETIDEISVLGGATVRSADPYITSLRVGNRNVLGGGLELSAHWRDGLYYRDTWGGRVLHPQFLGRHYELRLQAARQTHGSTWDGEVRHAFLTDLQRLAWRVSGGSSSELYPLLREHDVPGAIRVERAHADVGGVVRIGIPGRLSLFGASLSREHEDTDGAFLMVSDSGVLTDPTVTVGERFERHRVARVNALWGVRAVRFMRVTGFDALSAPQDVRKGFQLGTLLGRSLSVLGSEDDDIFAAADLYIGAGTPRVFGAMQLQAEGRQDYDENRWDGILGSGRAAVYVRLAGRHTFVGGTEWSGGWRQRIPFQLTLADAEGGVRGYGDSRAAGARRVVVRLEERWRFWRPRDLADIGLAVFADGGKLWAGDVPFGVSTNPKVGVGAGLLVALPPQSRHVWRLEFAMPVSKDPHAGWEMRLFSRDLTRVFWREPRDVARNRERSLPASVFSWP